ncbi:MAG: FeoA family protein [Candidatus Cyclobacteriaceae bacterium M2_1C_046]
MKTRSVADLRRGEKGIIDGFSDDVLSLKLLEMGCLPGTEIEVSFTAPFGGPICVNVSGYHLSLRKEEANTIAIQ